MRSGARAFELAPCVRTTPSGPGSTASRDSPVEDVAAVLRVRAHLAWPAPLVHRLRPRVAREHLGALDLVEGVVEGLVLDHDRLALAADHHRQLLPLEARRGDHAEEHTAELQSR